MPDRECEGRVQTELCGGASSWRAVRVGLDGSSRRVFFASQVPGERPRHDTIGSRRFVSLFAGMPGHKETAIVTTQSVGRGGKRSTKQDKDSEAYKSKRPRWHG